MKLITYAAAFLCSSLCLLLSLRETLAQDVTINFGSFFYTPADVAISVGDSVTWVGDFATHPLQEVTGPDTENPVSGGFAYGGPLSSYTYTFTAPGTFYYLCVFHPDAMRGSVTVAALTETPAPTPTTAPTPGVNSTPVPTATPQVCSEKPAKAVLLSPAKGTKTTEQSLSLTWGAVECATSYKVALRRGKKNNPVFKRKTVEEASYLPGKLSRGQSYFWSVKACNDRGCSKGASSKFTIQRPKRLKR